MNDIATIRKTIRETASKLLMEEIEFWMELDREDSDEYTECDALYDLEGTDIGETPAIKRSLRAVYIALGWYKPITQEQYDSIVCTHDKRREHPKIKGIRYEWVGRDGECGVC